MDQRLTIIIPSRNNYSYLVEAYTSIRKNLFFKDHYVMVYDDGDDGTYEKLNEWDEFSNDEYAICIPNETDEITGTGHAMNICSKMSPNEYLFLMHADMYISRNADLRLLKILTENPHTVVSLTRIEPPLHPIGKEKIVKNFGLYPTNFKEKQFLEYVEEISSNKITTGVFAPWAITKTAYDKIGGHDPQFNRYHEDADIFYRMKLGGLNFVQIWDKFVYHYTCRSNRFANGVETKNPEFEQIRHDMLMKFLNKWKIEPLMNEYSFPQIDPMYVKINVFCKYNKLPEGIAGEYVKAICDDERDEDAVGSIKFIVKNDDEFTPSQVRDFILKAYYIWREYPEDEYEIGNFDIIIEK